MTYVVIFPLHAKSDKLCKGFKSLKCAVKYLYRTWREYDDGSVQPVIVNKETKEVIDHTNI